MGWGGGSGELAVASRKIVTVPPHGSVKAAKRHPSICGPVSILKRDGMAPSLILGGMLARRNTFRRDDNNQEWRKRNVVSSGDYSVRPSERGTMGSTTGRGWEVSIHQTTRAELEIYRFFGLKRFLDDGGPLTPNRRKFHSCSAGP